MTSQIDLIKKVEIILTKKGFSDNIKARVGLILDESGSMSTLFRNGHVSRTVDRALTVGYKFDDNGEIDVWSFSHEVRERPPARQDDFGSYLKHNMLGGSTLYHPVLKAAARHYFEDTVKSSFFGFKKTVEKASDEPAFILFTTDGIPDSDEEAFVEVSKILRTYPRLFVQFIGIGHGHYRTLERLAEGNPNAAFATIEESDSDEDIFDKFLNTKARAVIEG